jgi:cobalt/nickel transport system ATP-binding protein
MSLTPAIEARDVVFTYPDGHRVLSGVSFRIFPGEKVALIGPNGCGKSTLIANLVGVLQPDAGHLAIDGVKVSPATLREVRRRAGVVFQDPNDQLFCPTVFEDVAFGPLNMGCPAPELDGRVQEALGATGLLTFDQRNSFHLSFGERKRLALATVLSCRPAVLIFDEPSSNLDPRNRRRLVDWLRASSDTIVLCTHELDIALEVCDRCLLLAEGRVIADGAASTVLYDRALLETYNLEMPAGLLTLHGLAAALHGSGIDHAERRVVEDFLHAHWHIHDKDEIPHLHSHGHAAEARERHAHGHGGGDGDGPPDPAGARPNGGAR